MTISVFLVVLFAAFLHASWNALVKGGDSVLLTTVLITMTGAVIAAAMLPFCRMPRTESFAYLGISVILQVIYFLLISRIYQHCDMSTAYPLMRGSAPLITAVIGTAALGESLSAGAWIGILLVCTGIFSMVVFGTTLRLKENRLAFLNAGIIAGYTVVDGIGVRLSDSPAAYVLWIMLLQVIALTGMQLGSGKRTFLAYAGRYWKLGVIGGLGMMGSYGLALWAMTAAPIVLVAALRETSILFALLISGLLLGEKIPRSKLMGALFIFSGVVMIRI